MHNFAALVGPEKFQELARTALVAAIGPITAATLKEYGITPQIQPDDYTIPAFSHGDSRFLYNISDRRLLSPP